MLTCVTFLFVFLYIFWCKIDGVEVAGRSFWFCVAYVCNFHKAERFKDANVALMGVLAGGKPACGSGMMEIFSKDLTNVWTEGILLPDGKRVYVYNSATVADGPAASLLASSKGHSAKQAACYKCHILSPTKFGKPTFQGSARKKTLSEYVRQNSQVQTGTNYSQHPNFQLKCPIPQLDLPYKWNPVKVDEIIFFSLLNIHAHPSTSHLRTYKACVMHESFFSVLIAHFEQIFIILGNSV